LELILLEMQYEEESYATKDIDMELFIEAAYWKQASDNFY